MAETDVLQAEMRAMREDVSEIKGAVSKVADALERLARLEERHSTVAAAQERAFGAISKVEARLRAVEQAQPIQTLASGWVVNGAWAAAGMLAMFVLKKAGWL